MIKIDDAESLQCLVCLRVSISWLCFLLRISQIFLVLCRLNNFRLYPWLLKNLLITCIFLIWFCYNKQSTQLGSEHNFCLTFGWWYWWWWIFEDLLVLFWYAICMCHSRFSLRFGFILLLSSKSIFCNSLDMFHACTTWWLAQNYVQFIHKIPYTYVYFHIAKTPLF